MSLAKTLGILSFLPRGSNMGLINGILPATIELKVTGFNSVYYFEHGKDFYHAPERHNTWEIVYVDRGEIIAITDGTACSLSEGKAIFREPNELHSHISNGEVSNSIFVVSFTAEGNMMDFFKKKIFTLTAKEKNLLTLFIEEAKNALGGEIQGDYINRHHMSYNEVKFGSVQLMTAYLEEFLIKLIRNDDNYSYSVMENSEVRIAGSNHTVEQIISYFQKNVYKNLSLSGICDRFYIGKSRLSAIFKEVTGKSPMQYFADMKTEEAKKLIRDDVLSIGEIAETLGYSGIHSFSRAFKAATGFTPTGYKKSIF